MDTIRHVAALPVIDSRDRERADRLSYIAMSSFVLEAEFAAVRREAEVEMKSAVAEAVKAERARCADWAQHMRENGENDLRGLIRVIRSGAELSGEDES